jgi:hypothetical protein
MQALELCTLGGHSLARYRSTDVRCVVPLSLMASFFLVLFACDARAEGRCPPGQYPVGGQGVGGCAPIPGGSSQAGQAAQSGPIATGRWIKTWGAIAGAASTGDMGASVGQITKREAISEALERCGKYGAKDCKIDMTYRNQCVAYADPAPGSKGVVSISVAGSKEDAASRVLDYCAQNGGGQCKVLYSDCSEPIFESF